MTQHLKLCEDVFVKRVKDKITEQEAKEIYRKSLSKGEFSSLPMNFIKKT